MQTLEIEEDGVEEQGKEDQIIRQKGTKSSADAISDQSDMMEEILSRLPAKTLVQFMCVSKPWRSIISDSSFVKLHSNRTNLHGLVIPAFYCSNFRRYFLFADYNGGSITHILTIPGSYLKYFTHVQHVNGLLLFCPEKGFEKKYFGFVYNPSTRKIFKVPPCGYDMRNATIYNCYLLMFNESCSEHKILNFKTIGAMSFGVFKPTGLEIEIFSLSTYTWRKIDVDFPLDPIVAKWFSFAEMRVCINSVIYFVLHKTKSILVFDLITETFSSMNFPPMNVSPCHLSVTAINGSLAAYSNKRIGNCNKFEFWILEDCNNHVWIKETIDISDCWINKNHTPYPVDFRGGEIAFCSNEISTNVLSIPMYDMKTGTFRFMEVNLSHDLLCSKNLRVNLSGVRSYVESMMPLKNSIELVRLISGKGNNKRSTTNS